MWRMDRNKPSVLKGDFLGTNSMLWADLMNKKDKMSNYFWHTNWLKY